MENSDKKAFIQSRIDDVLARRSSDTLGAYSESLESLVEDLKIYQYELEFQKEELLRIQEELQLSRDSFRDLFQHAPIGYVLLNSDFLIQECNQAFKQLFPIAGDCTLETDFRRFIATPYQDHFYHFWSALLKRGGLHNLRVDMVSPGQTETLMVHIQGNTFGSAANRHIRLSITDITESEKQTRKLIETEARFNNLVSRMNQAIVFGEVLYDEANHPYDFKFIAANQAFERLTGITPGNATGVRLLTVYPELPGAWREVLVKAASCDEPVFYEGFAPYLNKFLRVVLYKNQPGQLAAVIDDITDKKEAEAKLWENAALLDLALTASLTVAWEIDLSTLMLKAQGREVLRTTFGIETTDSIQLSYDDWSRLIYPDDMAIVINQLNSNSNYSDDLQVMRCRIFRTDGAIRWVELKGRVTKTSSEGLPLIVTGIMNDVTELVESQEIIETQNAELVLLNTQKDKLFSVIAHDLRSPFNTFLGFTEILAESAGSLTVDELKSISGSMHQSAVNLNSLLVNLLEWSRFQSGRVSFQPIELDLDELVKESVTTIFSTAQSKRISIETRIPKHVRVIADSFLLGSVVRNLLSNAVKYTHSGGVVSIEASRDQNRTALVIRDSGIGIPVELIPNLFTISANKGRRGTNNEPSTGLGLVLVNEFVTLMGGQVEVKSIEGEGTAFTVWLPSAAMLTAQQAIPEPEPFQEKPLPGIVLIEDDFISANLFSLILTRAGFKTIHFTNDEDFNSYFVEHKSQIALIITDILLPGKSGLDLAREVRERESTIPIVAITSYFSPSDRRKALEAGCNDYLAKPIGRQKLLAIVSEYV